MTLPHLITLTVGDWSHDGHNITEVVTIRCNIARNELLTAYEAGVKSFKLDVTERVAEEYEDGNITLEQWQKFAAAGLTLEELFGKARYELKEARKIVKNKGDKFGIYVNEFVKLWMFVAKQARSDLEYEIPETDDTSNINIGGYGLFST